VDERREGTRHLFVVNPAGFAAVQDFLAGFWTEHLARLSTALGETADPAPGQEPRG
jgi:hypothetical protein